MQPTDFWIFVSAVSVEFEASRRAVAERLERRGFTVKHQGNFRPEDADTLLRKLHDYIFDCDLVIAVVGEQAGAGRPSHSEALDFERMLPPGFDDASYTQWELLFATYYGKDVLLFGSNRAFTDAASVAGTSVRSTAQQRFVQWVQERGIPRESFDAAAELPERVAAVVEASDWLQQPLSAGPLPDSIVAHLEQLRAFSLRRLSDMAGSPILDVRTAARMFAQRVVVDPRAEHEELELPRAVLRSAELQRKPHRAFDQLLIVGDAGEGKTAVVHSLICELAEERRVRRWRLVPLLADCVTLSRIFGDDEGKDGAALRRWLALAVAPRHVILSQPLDPQSSEASLAEFSAALSEQGLRLLLIIDGFDELDPSATLGVHRVQRLLAALEQWEQFHKILRCVHIATTRPYFENVDGLTGMRRVELKRPRAHEVTRLARIYGVSESSLDRFREAFQDAAGIDSKFVYFRPLARYFASHSTAAGATGAAISRSRLMQLEVEHAIDAVVGLSRVDALLPAGTIEQLKNRLHHLLVLVALTLLDQRDPERPGHLSRESIMRLADVAAPEVRQLVDRERLLSKVISVLIYAAPGRDAGQPGGELFYRLPHNEYRDYLLADGLFRLIRRWNPAHPDIDAKTAAALAQAYRRAVRVSGFLEDKIREVTHDRKDRRKAAELSVQVIKLMNDGLPNQNPQERSDCSPHGAMLTLLLSIGPVPTQPCLTTAGVNFYGAVARAESERRVQLPGNRDWSGSVLREADLRGADLSHSKLDGVDLDNAQLNGADLTGASLLRASMRNVAMGRYKGMPTVLTGARFDDGVDDQSAADWFNYRFPGLKGYYCFWDLEGVAAGGSMLVAGSRGQLLWFNLSSDDWGPLCLQTEHTDDILDISRHPTLDVIVTTSRDKSVRIHKLPVGDPGGWPSRKGDDGVTVYPIEQICVLSERDLFAESNYPRRAQFSKSGRWLAVIARDPRVAFLRVCWNPASCADIRPGVFGRAHTGPVMCIGADTEPAYNASLGVGADRFYTAGYDGRVVLWTEREAPDDDDVWNNPVVTKQPARDANGDRAIIRALVAEKLAGARLSEGFWVGMETGGRLCRYRVKYDDLVEDEGLGTQFDSGVFCLALEDERKSSESSQTRTLAVGLASGDVLVFRMGDDGTVDWKQPTHVCQTDGDIVRAIAFVDGGARLVVATWDAGLHVFAIGGERTGERLRPSKSFVYPAQQWQPERDIDNFEIAEDIDLRRSRGLASRMKQYLQCVGRARKGQALA